MLTVEKYNLVMNHFYPVFFNEEEGGGRGFST